MTTSNSAEQLQNSVTSVVSEAHRIAIIKQHTQVLRDLPENLGGMRGKVLITHEMIHALALAQYHAAIVLKLESQT